MTNGLLVNNRSLEDIVFQYLTLDGYLTPIVPERAVQPLAFGVGVFGSGIDVKPRTVKATLDLRAASLPDRTALIDAVRRRVPHLCELQSVDIPGRYLVAVLSGVEVEFHEAAHGNPNCYVILTWTAVDGGWRDIEPTCRALSSSRVTCPVGTGVSAARITLNGASTPVVNPVVITRNMAGEELSRLTLSGSLTTNMALHADAALHALTLYDAGTLQTGTSAGDNWLASGAFPLLSGEDGENVTVELSSDSGTPTGVLLYTRVY